MTMQQLYLVVPMVPLVAAIVGLALLVVEGCYAWWLGRRR